MPLVTARGIPEELDYAEPTGTATPGTLVTIPMAGRVVEGVVCGRAEETDLPAEKLKAVASISEKSIPTDLVDLARWLSADVASTTARALGLVTPPGGAPKRRLWVWPGVEEAAAGEASSSSSDEEGGAAPGRKLTAAQQELLDGLTASGARPAGDELARWRALEKRGLVTIAPVDERRRPPSHAVGSTLGEAPPLTDEQQAAVDRIAEVARQEQGGDLLLHGVTGSGKTEVYLRATADAIERGRTVLVLVPEIGLAPQIAHRFTQRFGDVVAILHSGLGGGARRDEWWRVRSGEATIVVGARSAVFAPLDRLGLVIVDEEHDSSFKSGEDPRYDARRIAAWRARHSSAVLLCGSATPRPESLHALPIIAMKQRVDGRPMPPVQIVDMAEASGALHPTTREALTDSRKAIVLLNRRGWSNFLECRSCSHVWECPNCDVTLVLHRGRRSVDCHHCGHSERIPSGCPNCGSVSLSQHGIGTERLADELTELGLPVLRVDADINDPGAVLAEFGAADRAVLVGTQLVAKGHDFPDVDLGVVLDADATLRFPDFRAEERTFQLVTQLAGRAGRGGGGQGKVIVQTRAPEHPVILAAAAHDASGFLETEIKQRQRYRNPPFSTLIRVIVAHHDQYTAVQLSDRIAGRLRDRRVGEVLGPAHLFRLRGKEREQIEIKAARRGPAVVAVREAVAAVQGEASRVRAQLIVDVGPQ